MGFRIASQTKSMPGPVLAASVTRTKPLALYRGELAGERGVFAVVQHSAAKQAYFYPEQAILEGVERKGGREGFVYKEGFDPRRSADTIAPMVKREVPRWRAFLAPARQVDLNRLAIQQPGIDMWRMLCFALDHAEDPFAFLDTAPPLFGLQSTQLVLHAGNHRALFALASEIAEVSMTWITIPSRAVNYRAGMERQMDYVARRFGNNRVQALGQDFVRQVESAEG